ncbi:hypothetical protein ACHHY8_02545 [Enterobacter cloacae complex sp. 2024EL-00215]|uniref:hypothetical protein n=1 Tax=unclassified Enterobacter cloacae complex TaxID=2757714 RepID=UPI0037539F67
MDGYKIQQKLYKGYAKAAKRTGTNYQHYRPSSANNPLDASNRLPDLYASLNADDPTFSRPNVFGKATWYGIMDGAQCQVFDYVKGIEGTLYIAAMQQLLPIYMVDCNRVVSVLRPVMDTGPGELGYGGDTAANEALLMTGWPCSMLQGSKGEKNEVGLPADAKNPWFNVLLPFVDGVYLRTADIITDEIGGRYKLTSAELTDLGWRLTAQQVRP